MKHVATLFATLLIFSILEGRDITLETGKLRMVINDKGQVCSFFDKVNQKEYHAIGQVAPLMSIRVNNDIEQPGSLRQMRDKLILSYPVNKVEAEIRSVVNSDYISLELISISKIDQIELVIWGPYPTTISETIGECVGVVRDKKFAIGIQALTVKTLGGYPTEENDIEPSYDIFASGNLVDISSEWKNKKSYRGQTARVQDFGSVVQAYCRNRNQERIISNWAHDYYVAPPFADGGVIGTKIALFGCEPDKVLETIGKIEVKEGLPHPIIDGEWAKTAKSATASYLIIGFDEGSFQQALDLTKKAGLQYLYDGGPFRTWGHFVLDEKSYPENWTTMKKFVEIAEKQGIRLGVHTLTNFITTNDAYVTPVPDKRLAKVGESILTADIDATTQEIPIQSPQFFNQMKNNSLTSVVIGNEIIRYKEVSGGEPWRLTGCLRGAYGTTPSAHRKGDVIGKLMDHGYKVFLSDASLSEEIAINIANLFNATGLLQLSFDGLEGVWSTGMGQYARSLFTKTWYDHLKPELKGRVINDASNPSHFNWHINTRYNWGEPWYAGFRESQTYYRLMNQDFYRRNFLPSMLGWFSMSAQTSLEDAEWLLARAAGFDAGFALNLNHRNVERNGQSDQILKAINTWETARMAGAFSPEQKHRMEDISNEYHLDTAGPGQWTLYPFEVQRFSHEQKIRQPGEPLFSTFEFDNPYPGQALQFIITLVPVDKASESSVEKISLEINKGNPVEINLNMEPYQNVKLDGKGNLQLLDRNWNLVQNIDLTQKIPNLLEGKNIIQVDASFRGEGPSLLKIELKSVGPGELVKAPSAH